MKTEAAPKSEATGNLQGQRDRLVVAMLTHVPFDGWSREALAAAAADLGISPGQAGTLFPAGGRQALDHFLDLADRAMVEDAAALPLAEMGVRARIEALLMARFVRWQPYREAVRAGLAVVMRPSGMATGTRSLMRTVDRIWRLAGDRSHDYNFYSKRGLLASVYSSSLLCWLGDPDEDLAVTRAFVARRLDEVLALPKWRARLGSPLGELATSARAFVAAVRRPHAGPL